jgi:LacI family transcriptional regulator/LacI family repressor for deo operon, udp, cdd, tsx, nupC, and nupG
MRTLAFALLLALAPAMASRAETGQNGMIAAEHRLAAEAGLRILQRGGNAVDAAVATALAVGVVNRLFDRGVRVPDDLSIVGVDDTSLAEMVTPRLTTVRLPADAMGRAAVRMLFDTLAGRDTAIRHPHVLHADLIIRSSTGPVPVTTGEGVAKGT